MKDNWTNLSDMDIKRVQEVFGEDDDSITRDDDSIPLADENPSDVLEESLISEDKRKVKVPECTLLVLHSTVFQSGVKFFYNLRLPWVFMTFEKIVFELSSNWAFGKRAKQACLWKLFKIWWKTPSMSD